MLLLPPAPAARVLDGRTLATLSARSAAAFLLIAVAGPPGGFGEAGRAVVEPVEGELTGDEGRGEDCAEDLISPLLNHNPTRSSIADRVLAYAVSAILDSAHCWNMVSTCSRAIMPRTILNVRMPLSIRVKLSQMRLAALSVSWQVVEWMYGLQLNLAGNVISRCPEALIRGHASTPESSDVGT